MLQTNKEGKVHTILSLVILVTGIHKINYMPFRRFGHARFYAIKSNIMLFTCISIRESET